jgi:CubicO group peptidase (beta-lactamase class C family)
MLSCLGKLVRASNTHSATNRETYRGCLCRWSFLLSLISVYANAQINNPPELGQRLQSLIDSRFAATKCPGLSVAVASHNRIILSKAWGKADLEQNVPMTTASVHRLASLSKPITGTIIMDLVENGKLALDASIRQYLARLPEDYQKVTVRHLLSHQSGIGFAADDLSVVFSTKHYATAEDALKLVSPSPVFEPGSKVEYSSAAFTVLGAAAEAVTGKSFQQLSKDFFARHGINGFLLDDPYAIVPNRVRGYLVGRNSEIKLNNGRTISREYLKGTSGEITNAVLYDISNRYPAAGFDASAEDLLRFVIAVGTGQVLLAETLNQMWTAQSTSDGKKSVFGLGWGVSDWKGKTKLVGMNGLEPSSQGFLRYLPEPGIGVVVICNAEGAEGLPLNEIIDTTIH